MDYLLDLLDLTYALIGVGALLAGVLPRLLADRPLSMPIVFLGLGMAVFAVVPDLPDPDPLRYPDVAARLTEIGVIVALMGAGLKLDRPVGWRSWSSTWRLLAIAMPLTIAATAFLGWWWVGLAPATALLLGSALAPTDPVLAADVQVGEPGGHEDGEDEVRFALTSEAGLNDALAFPFVSMAIAMATAGAAPAGWIGGWSPAGTASSRYSRAPAPSAPGNARTSTTRCCTTSSSRSSACSRCCCWCFSAGPSCAACSGR